MILPVFLQFFLLSRVLTIDFLLDKAIDFQTKELLLETSVMVTFKQNEHMAKVDTFLTETGDKLNVWRIPPGQIDARATVVAKFLKEFGVFTQRIKNQINMYRKILNKATPDPVIPVDKNVTITIDEAILTAFFDDVGTAANNSIRICTDAGSLDLLMADHTELANYGGQASALISLLKDYLTAIKTFVSSVKLSLDNVVPPIVKNDLLLDGNRLIDLDHLEFITYGRTDDNLMFYLEVKIYHTGPPSREYIPIAYFSYSLDDTYVYNNHRRRVTKTLTESESSPIHKHRVDACLDELTIGMKNYTKIITFCDFVYNDVPYVLTPNGILFQTADTSLLGSINQFFDKQFTVSDFPLYLTFNGTFIFSTKSLQTISVTRTSQVSYQKSVLTEKEKSFLKQKLFNGTTPEIIEEKLRFIEYIMEDYDEILVNLTIILILMLGVFVSKCVYGRLNDNQRNVPRRATALLLNRYRRNRQ